MAKKSARIAQRLADRRAGYTGQAPNKDAKHPGATHRPGSKSGLKAS